MANTPRQKVEEEVKMEKKPKKMPKIKAKPQPVSRPAAPRPRPVQRKGINKVVKAIRKGFESVFGGGILQKINIRKNWKFILFVVILIIILIYSNLKIQSKRQLIIKLNQEIVVAKDEAMDAIEEGYHIDKQKEREVLQEGEERGFHNSGYIPYIIESEKSKK